MNVLDEERRFWGKVLRKGADECWEWTGARGRRGHGYFRLSSEQRLVPAARYAWSIVNGPAPTGRNVRHTCESAGCCNPRHLTTQLKPQVQSVRKPRPTVAERLWASVDKGGPTPEHRPELGPCWVWTGGKDHNGYGSLQMDGRAQYAHRVAWQLEYGSPEGLFVLHSCDNPSCVRVEHLFLGTQAENMADKVRKSRQQKGERCHGAKLTDERVRAIKAELASGATHAEAAKRHGVHRRTVTDIAVGATWRHVA